VPSPDQPPRDEPGGFSGVTSAEFKILFPAFVPTNDAWVTAALAQAEAMTSDAWDASVRDYAVGLTAAAALARSPQGRAAGLKASDGASTYSRELTELRKGAACCLSRVV